MTPRELKNSIRQLAIQGRLVEQRPEEGTAAELYAQIQREKQALIKAGKLKNDRRTIGEELPSPEDVPFDIPESWKWCYLGGILNKLTDGTHKTPKYSTSGVKFVSVKDMSSGVLSLESTKFITPEEHEELFARCDPMRGDMLLSKVGTTGVPAIVDTDEPFSLFVSVALLKYNHSCIDESFLYFLLKSPLVQSQATENTRGVGNKNWVLDAIANTIVVLPPFDEQKRIVARIEELLPLVDRYEQAWNRLEDLNKRFPGDLQKSLLQLAIQGKLVEQRPEEGTGEDLYQQIQREKQALIKVGKLKKEKPFPEISEDEIPFDIPESWKLVRWGDLSESIQYGFNAPAQESGRIRMVRISDIQDGGVQWNTVPYCEIDEKEISTYLLKPNDILFARTGGTVGKSYLVREVPEEAIYAGYLIRTRYSSLLCPEYMKHFMGSQLYWNQLRNGTIATAQPNCNGKTLSKMILPLPPLTEQKRIVAKLEEVFPWIVKFNSEEGRH